MAEAFGLLPQQHQQLDTPSDFLLALEGLGQGQHGVHQEVGVHDSTHAHRLVHALAPTHKLSCVPSTRDYTPRRPGASCCWSPCTS